MPEVACTAQQRLGHWKANISGAAFRPATSFTSWSTELLVCWDFPIMHSAACKDGLKPAFAAQPPPVGSHSSFPVCFHHLHPLCLCITTAVCSSVRI